MLNCVFHMFYLFLISNKMPVLQPMTLLPSVYVTVLAIILWCTGLMSIFVSKYSLIMTEKQKSILDSALNLFAQKGYNTVPTSAISKDAGVSEGLIFRHFGNKAGLLTAIMQMGKEKIRDQVHQLNKITDPRERVMAVMELPFHMHKDDYSFWRLLYSLKWQQDSYDAAIVLPIREVLQDALSEMKYADVEVEVDLIESYFDGFITTILLKGDSIDKERLLSTLRGKYS